MKKNVKGIFVLVFILFGLSAAAWAQFGQTGSLNGTVNDKEGKPLPGVGVTIKSPAIVLKEMNEVTNLQGGYRFPSLPPGVYEITYALDGMSTLVRKDIIIGAGKTTTLDVVLEIITLETTVVVTGQTPTVDIQSSTRTTNLDKELISALPAARTLDSYFNMVPGVVAESNAQGPMSSSHGASVRDNAYNVDGVNMSAPDVGTQRMEFGTDIMEELTVQSGGLSAEYGDSMGTMINVITKSGGNKFSGSASIYFNNHSLQSTNTSGTPLEGRLSGYKYAFEPGITLGGPIAENKIWFFTNFSFNKTAPNIAGYPWDAAETTSVNQLRICPYLKFTIQPGQRDKLVLSYNFSNYIQNHATADAYHTISSTVKWASPTHVINAQWTHFFNSNLYADFKVGYLKGDDNITPKGDQPLYNELSTGRYSGNYAYRDIYKRNRLQINAHVTRYLESGWGSHEIKLGGELEKSDMTRDMTPNRDSRNQMSQIYTFSGMPYYGIWYSDWHLKQSTLNAFAFVQDSWKPAKRLTLNLGVRFSHQRSIIPAQNQDEGPVTLLGRTFNRSVTESSTPIKRTDLSPRLGISYDLTGDGKTLVKASFSRYVQPNLMQYFVGVNPNLMYYYAQLLTPSGTPVPGAYLTAYFPVAYKAGYGDYKVKSPCTDEITVSFERELFADWGFSARYIKKRDRNLLETVDANQLDMDKLMSDGELVWTNWEEVTFVDPFDGQQKTVWNRKKLLTADTYVVNPPGAKRDYDGLEITLTKRYSKRWSMMASYVWQNSRGLVGNDFQDSWGGQQYYNNPNAHINAYGRFPLERRHQFKFQGMVKGPWGVNASGFFRFFSGGRYTRLINTSDLHIPLNQGYETIYAETRGSNGLPAQAILDLRLEKTFQMNAVKLALFVDGFNLFNGNKATAVETRSSSPSITFKKMTSIQDPRIFRLGAKFAF